MSFKLSLDSRFKMTCSDKESTFERPFAIPACGCPPVVASSDSMKWFVMRITYSRELKAEQLLREAGVECFVPMMWVRDENGEHSIPAIHNLIFVHTSREFMDDYKHKMENECPLRYTMDKSTGLPMVVREKEMEDFMRVTNDKSSDILYLDNPDVAATKGTPVEVMFGQYKGIHGKLLRVRKDRKVVLQLAGMVAIALSGIPMEWCRLIDY